MTDDIKKKPNNVKTIRKDIVLPTEEAPKLEIDQFLVESLENLVSQVKSGEITEVVWVCSGDKLVGRGILGWSPNAHLMNSNLETALMLFKEERVYPAMLGEDYYLDFDEQ
jgi:hypothetical protein